MFEFFIWRKLRGLKRLKNWSRFSLLQGRLWNSLCHLSDYRTAKQM